MIISLSREFSHRRIQGNEGQRKARCWPRYQLSPETKKRQVEGAGILQEASIVAMTPLAPGPGQENLRGGSFQQQEGFSSCPHWDLDSRSLWL